jgi:predicted acylesterase/phospholipase RssA
MKYPWNNYAYATRQVWRGLLIPVLCLSLGCEILPGHWRPGWNKPAAATDLAIQTAGSWGVGKLETDDHRFVGLTISGGGSRAANFGAAVMLELERRGLLSQVDVISAVSGGTLPATYYPLLLKGGGAFDEATIKAAMGEDFQGTWLWRWLLPHNIFRYWLSDFTRSDIMVQVFNNSLYHEATFGDLPLRPKLLLNATTRNDHTRFTFTDETFQRIHSTLAHYRVANAVNASSAFPGAFDDVTLEQYGIAEPRYVHLYDGGPMDNLGVQAMTEYLQRAVAGRALNDPDLFPQGCVLFVVDATPDTDNDGLAAMQSSRTTLDYFVNTNALDSVDAMLTASRTTLLKGMGFEAIDRATSGFVRLSDRQHCRCEVRHIALRHLPYLEEQEELAGRALRISTKFHVSEREQADLFEAAHWLVQELEEQQLLTGASMGPHCDAPSRASQTK